MNSSLPHFCYHVLRPMCKITEVHSSHIGMAAYEFAKEYRDVYGGLPGSVVLSGPHTAYHMTYEFRPVGNGIHVFSS